MSSFELDDYRFLAADWIPAIVHLESVDSTNNYAREKVRSGEYSLPLLVIADTQTAGRGRQENLWWTGRGGIALTLGLPQSDLQKIRLPLQALAIGLAVRNVIALHVEPGRVSVKWPNDVLLDGKKVAGILIENIVVEKPVSIIGIGINLNNELSNFPAELQATATTVASAAGPSVERSAVIDQLLTELRSVVLTPQPERDLLRDYRRSHALTGQRITVRQGDVRVEGRCTGIGDDGSLLVRGADDEISIHYGTVTSYGD